MNRIKDYEKMGWRILWSTGQTPVFPNSSYKSEWSNPLMIYKGQFCINIKDEKLWYCSDTQIVEVGTGTSFDGVETDCTLSGSGLIGDELSVNNLIIIDYNTIYSASLNGSLIPGQKYLIDDFSQVYNLYDGITMTVYESSVGETEPLIVMAVDNYRLHTEAKSIVYPNDILHYSLDLEFNTDIAYIEEYGIPIKGFKGLIKYRKDTIKNVECWYDWRSIKFRRWVKDGIYCNWEADGESDYDDYFTFNGVKLISNISIGKIDFEYANSLGYYSSLNNITFLLTDSTTDCASFTIGFNNYNNTIINGGFNNNTIGTEFRNNLINYGFTNNAINNGFFNNIIGEEFQLNLIMNGFEANSIGNNFNDNSIENSFFRNNIKTNFNKNRISSNFTNNIINNDFQLNDVCSNVSGIDFSQANRVYSTYNCNIVYQRSNTFILTYYNIEALQFDLIDS